MILMLKTDEEIQKYTWIMDQMLWDWKSRFSTWKEKNQSDFDE